MAKVILVVGRLLTASALCVQRQVSISDLGHDDDWRGWYDLRGCGEGQCWDYCRWVGNNGSQGDPRLTTGSAHNNSSKWTCVLANETDVDTVWDRWGTVWPTGLYSTRCPSQGAQARTDAPTDVPTDAARRAQATQACGALENNAGAELPNMPFQTISSCDCKQICDAEPLCKGWTYSAGMHTVSGKNCWLRQEWAGALYNCGTDCQSGPKACGVVENRAGAALPNMPIATIGSCDCKQRCYVEPLCAGWTYSAGMHTVSGNNCWLRQEWGGPSYDCGADCRSGPQATNLALGRSASASTSYSDFWAASAVTDGLTYVHDGAWLLPDSVTGWVQVNLGSLCIVSHIRWLNLHQWDYRSTLDYHISLSTDNINFVTVWSNTMPFQLPPTWCLYMLPSPMAAQIVRFNVDSYYGMGGGLQELEVYGDMATQAPTFAPTPLPTQTPTLAPTVAPTPLPTATPTPETDVTGWSLVFACAGQSDTNRWYVPESTALWWSRLATRVKLCSYDMAQCVTSIDGTFPIVSFRSSKPVTQDLSGTPCSSTCQWSAWTGSSSTLSVESTCSPFPAYLAHTCGICGGPHIDKNPGGLCGMDCLGTSGVRVYLNYMATNLALGRNTSASASYDDYWTASTVTDGLAFVHERAWLLPNLVTGWVQVNLGSVCLVSHIRWVNLYEWVTKSTLDYHISLSTDNINFATVWSNTMTYQFTPTWGVYMLPSPLGAQIVRFNVDSYYGDGGGLQELEVYGDMATQAPTLAPTPLPTQTPTLEPTESPTAVPTFTPTQKPTGSPTAVPTVSPTAVPTVSPTAVPTQTPTQKPTESPTAVPTFTPSHQPTESPTEVPTQKPTQEPTVSPTAVPTQMPTQMQTREPTALPTALPTFTPTHEPTKLPTLAPSLAPTLRPTKSPANTSNGEPLLVQHFIDALAEARTAQVMDFIASNDTRAVSKIGDTVLVVQKLSLTEAVGGMVPVKSEGGTEVAVPTSLLAQFGGEVIFAVAEFKEGTFPFAGDDSTQTSVGRPKVRVTGVVDLGITDPKTGETVPVEDLDPPLIFTLGVNRTDQAVCGFFDEVLQKWSTEGISLEQSSVGSNLRCATTHLSFFGSIVEGMLKTLACSNFSLLTSLAYAEFAFTEWASDIGALLLWIFLGLILVLFVITIALDYYRHHSSYGWRDEYFLFPGEGPAMDVLEDDSPSRTLQTHGCGLRIISVVICSVGSVLSEPLVEIVEEMIADMLGDFWYVYSVLKNIFSTLEGVRQCSTVTVIAWLLNFSEALSCSSALRAAGGHTWRDVEDMELVKEGLELFEATKVRRHDGAYVESEVEFRVEIDAERSNEEVSFRENAHYNHITKRLAHFDGHVSSIARSHGTNRSSRTYCVMIAMIFLNELPVFRIFFQSIGTPSSMRFLYFMLDISGMLMLTTMFTSVGTSRSRRSTAETQSEDVDSVDPCEINNFEEQLGRVIVIGIAAAVLCVVPTTIISKLRSRKFRLIDNIGSSAWKKQLRVWCCRDILTWILGIGYILWCVNISFIYVISVAPDDQFEWFVSIVTSVAEDGLVIPAVLAVCLPAIVRIFSMVLELSRLRVHADSSDEIEERQRRFDSSGEIINVDAELRVACSEKKLQDPQEHEAAQHVNSASEVRPVRDVDTAVAVIAMDSDNALMQDRRRLASKDIMEPREAQLASELETASEGIAVV